jgi:hypothetical protein
MRTTMLALLAATYLGCDRPPPAPPPNDAPITEEPTRTIVTLQPNGPPIVRTDIITRDQFIADIAARNGIGVSQQAISTDPNCVGSSMWLFDSTGNTPGPYPDNHEICFYKNGVDGCVDLSTFIRFCNTFHGVRLCYPWASHSGSSESNAIGSFWAGQDVGRFTSLYDGTGCSAPIDFSAPPFYPFYFDEAEANAQSLPSFPMCVSLCFCY